MKQAILGVVLVGVLATPAWAGCAWVLWAEGPAIPTHRAEKAFEDRAACEKALPAISKEIQNRDGLPRWFTCLPDTVDPRTPKK